MGRFQRTMNFKNEGTLVSYGIKTVTVPENMTYLLQLLDPITNGSLKKF